MSETDDPEILAELIAGLPLEIAHAPGQAWEQIERAYLLARQQEDALAEAQIEHLAGVCLVPLGRLAEACVRLGTVAIRLREMDQPIAAACALRDRASAFFLLGDYPAAAADFDVALAVLTAEAAPLERSRCLREMAFMASFRHDMATAVAYIDAARALITPEDSPLESAALLYVEGIAAARRNDFPGAALAYSAAATRLEALGANVLLGRVYIGHGFTLLAQEHLPEAQAIGERALEILERLALPPFIAMAYDLLAVIATSANRFDDAYNLIEHARIGYEANGMEVYHLQARLHRANIDFYLQNWRAAEETYAAVATAFRERGARHLAMIAESNLGMILWNQGRFDAGLLHTHAALGEATALNRNDDIARCYRNLAGIYADLGDVRHAHEYYRQALVVLAGLDTPLTIARVQNEYADFCRRIGDYDRAARLLDEARPVIEGQQAPVFVAQCDLQRAYIAFARGELALATSLASACAATFAVQHTPLALAQTWVLQGELLRSRNDSVGGHRLYLDALRVVEMPMPDEAARIAPRLAAIAEDAGDLAGALAWRQRGISLLQQARSRVPTEHLAMALAREYAPQLRAALQLALRLDRPDIALGLAEDARAQVALAWIEGQRRSLPMTPQTLALVTRAEALGERLDQLAEPSTTEHATPELAALQAEYDEALALLRRFGSDVVPGTATPFDIERCCARFEQLPQGWQALVYWLDEDWLVTWQWSAEGLHVWQHMLEPAERFALDLCCDPDAASRLYLFDCPAETMYDDSPEAVQLQSVANLVLPPGLDISLQPDSLLILVPAGPLHHLPFAALPLAGQPLMTHATLAISPSLQLIDRLIARPPSSGHGALAIGVPQHATRSKLPAACAEAAMVATTHPETDVWCDGMATTTRLLEASRSGQLATYRLVHLATHAWGHMRAEHAGIALADGDLRVTDMAGLHFDAALLVLAACESGLGTVLPGEENIGLVYAALQAGARALLATLWQVDDDTSLALMRDFYALRQRGRLGPHGLAQMQRAAWAAGRPAYDWATYCWIGMPMETEHLDST